MYYTLSCSVCQAYSRKNVLLTFRSICCTLVGEKGGVHLLICNLASILQEMGKSITEVSKETGISRTTLTALSSNKSSGIQFETINTLCSFLDIKPGDLFLYSPLNIETCEILPELTTVHYLGNSVLYSEIMSLHFSQGWGKKGDTVSLSANVNARFDATENILSVDMVIFNSRNEDLSILQDLPITFLSALERELAYDHTVVSYPLDKICGEMHWSVNKSMKLRYSFHWPAGIGK